jgi:NitT/TauT family transport system substrate-binding protein
MKRRGFALGTAATALAANGPAGAQALRVIRTAAAPIDAYRAIQYAAHYGIFAKYNVPVETTFLGNGAAAAAALVSGSIEVALVNVLTLFQAHLRGIPMTALSPNVLITSANPAAFTLVLKDSPLQRGRDLNGKTIGTPGLGDIISVATLAWIDQNGGDSKSVRVIEIGSGAALPILEQGRADAVSINEPFVSQALATGKVRALGAPLSVIAPRYQAGAFAAMEPVVRQNLDLMTRFARAVHEAGVYCNEHLPETVELLASYSGIAPDVLRKMSRTIDPEYVEAANLQPLIDVLAKYGTLEHGFRAEEVISSAALKRGARA